MNEGGKIVINRTTIKARWYIQEKLDKKIIITNVPPHVPHNVSSVNVYTTNVIIDVINSCRIKPFSAMKFLPLRKTDLQILSLKND